MDFIIQRARQSDCLPLARYINESCEGAIEYLIDENNHQSSLEIMAQQLSRETHYSYANSIVAIQADQMVGMALSFPADGLLLSEQMYQQCSQQRLRYIQYFVENKLPESWHLDALCVCSDRRSQGIGAALLENVKNEARQYAFKELEVFVFATNKRAIKFYENNEFVARNEIDTRDHEFLSSRGPLCLMSVEL